MYVRALKSFDKIVDTCSLKEVHFVDISDKMVSTIQAELDTSWTQPCSEHELRKDKDFIHQCLGNSVSMAPGSLHDPQMKAEPKLDESDLPQPASSNLPDGFYKFSEKVSVNIFQHDIFETKMDVFASWEDGGLYVSRPLVKALVRHGGSDYESERRKLSTAIKGDIIPTSAGKLQHSRVFHVVVGTLPTVEEFSSCLRKLFGICVKEKSSTVLLPVFNNMFTAGELPPCILKGH